MSTEQPQTSSCAPVGSPTRTAVQTLAWTAAVCGLSLVIGVGIAQYLLREQTQVQRLMVAQLKGEIRGLTGDIQRMELALADSAHRCDDLASRREAEHESRLHSELRTLTAMAHQVDRKMDSAVAGQQICLAQFESFRRMQMAIPYDQAVHAVDRLVQSQFDALQALQQSLRAQLDHNAEQLELAQSFRSRGAYRNERGQRFGSTAWFVSPPGGSAPHHSPLSIPLPQFRSVPQDAVTIRQRPGRSSPEIQSEDSAAQGKLPTLVPITSEANQPIAADETLPVPTIRTAQSNRPSTFVPHKALQTPTLYFSSGRKVASEGAEAPSPALR